ncbi:MAG: CHAT domain-containing protein, partial [Thermodesulfobacteriota bacterium]
VARALPEKAALVEILRTGPAVLGLNGSEARSFPARYLALVLPARAADRTTLVDLGPADEIDQAVTGFLEAAGGEEKTGGSTWSAVRRLHDLVLVPLKDLLGGVEEVVVSSEEPLSLIPFEIMAGPNGRFPLEDHVFIYLNSAREILYPALPAAQADRVMAMGDPDVDLYIEGAGAGMTLPGLDGPEGRFPSPRPYGISDLNLTRIPGAAREVQAAAQVWPKGSAEVLLGGEAREDRLWRLSGPLKVLHLAAWLARPGAGVGWTEDGPDEPSFFSDPFGAISLALAGANNALLQSPGPQDGLLSAEEVLGLDLSGVEIVVLSLRYKNQLTLRQARDLEALDLAFRRAGARAVVMNLWPVPDQEALEMTRALHTALAGGEEPVRAFRTALLHLKQAVERRHGRARPDLWGAWVFRGLESRPTPWPPARD